MNKQMSLGQISSLTYCKKCHSPIEIYTNQESVKCKYCEHINDLILNINIVNDKDVSNDMDKNLEIKISKTLSYLLRHNPKKYDIELDVNGFADINSVINGLKQDYPYITIKELQYIVKNDDKGRYEINDNLIRALYGHSIKQEIKKNPSKPPTILYHGTKQNVLDLILTEGIKSMQRQKVCLSSDIDTAKIVGDRRKNSDTVILQVRAEEAYNDGINFYTEHNGIYMSDDIPPKYIEILK